jgi:hypothetical protein
MARFDQPIEPMTLGNMRELGLLSHLLLDDVAHYDARATGGDFSMHS